MVMPVPEVPWALIFCALFVVLIFNNHGTAGGICGSKGLTRNDSAPELRRKSVDSVRASAAPIRRAKSTSRNSQVKRLSEYLQENSSDEYQSWNSSSRPGTSSGYRTSTSRNSQSSRVSYTNNRTPRRRPPQMYGGYRYRSVSDVVDPELSSNERERQMQRISDSEDRLDHAWGAVDIGKFTPEQLYYQKRRNEIWQEDYKRRQQEGKEWSPSSSSVVRSNTGRRQSSNGKRQQSQQPKRNNAKWNDNDNGMITLEMSRSGRRQSKGTKRQQQPKGKGPTATAAYEPNNSIGYGDYGFYG